MGIALGVIAVITLVAFGGLDGIMLTNNPFYKRKDLATIPLDRVLAVVAIFYSLLMAAPLAIVGRGILRFQPWAKTLGLFVAALTLLFFPIGTGIGIYTLWVLTDEATEFLFANVPAGGARR
ncbi:MAG: hypothetical protein JNM66_24770 [Bryobacterales bacterium]|nr:hypothetical protein [Bryobacterales bacterium]